MVGITNSVVLQTEFAEQIKEEIQLLGFSEQPLLTGLSGNL